MLQKKQHAVGVVKPLLAGTFALVRSMEAEITASKECFGQWVSLEKYKPVHVKSPTEPGGVPLWARLKRFGGNPRSKNCRIA